VRVANEVGPSGDYPGLGRWPRRHFWNRFSERARVAIRLPGTLQVKMSGPGGHSYYAWYEAITENTYRYFQFFIKRGDTLTRRKFQASYWLQRRWLNRQFTDQDGWMIHLMPMTAPERLYRPDASIIAWRRLCEHARGEGGDTAAAATSPESTSLESPLAAATGQRPDA
jgi:hypothetical protein